MGQMLRVWGCALFVFIGLLGRSAVAEQAAEAADDPFAADAKPVAAAPKPMADEKPARSATKSGSSEDARARIERVLDQPLTEPLDFVEQPIRDVAQIISETYDIPIQFDIPALDAVAASPDAEVTVQITNVSLRSALNLLLKNSSGEELTHIIDNEVLLITTVEEAQSRLETTVYRVDDLIAPHPTYTPWDYDADYDALIDAIVATIDHESWMENGTGEGEIYPFPPGMIVVTQTPGVHEKIERLIAEMRKTKAAVVADQRQQLEDSRDTPVTRGFPVYGKDGLTAPENRGALVEAIKKSIDWESADGETPEDSFVIVLPNRIMVRHLAPVVRQAQLVIYEISHSRQLGPGMGGGGAHSATDGRDGYSQPDKTPADGVEPAKRKSGGGF